MYMQILTIGAGTGKEFQGPQVVDYPKDLAALKNLMGLVAGDITEAATKHQSMTVTGANEPMVGPIYTWISEHKSQFIFGLPPVPWEPNPKGVQITYMYQVKINFNSKQIVLCRVYGARYPAGKITGADLFVTHKAVDLIHEELQRRLPTTGGLIAKSSTLYWAAPFLIIRAPEPDTYYVGSATPIPLLPKELKERRKTNDRASQEE